MEFEISDSLRKNLLLVGACFLILVGSVGVKNLITPNEPVRVGYTEVSTNCIGIDTGICIGMERRNFTTYNYDNYTEPEPGTENYYRRIESELMIRAYNICTHSMNGMEWTDQVEYMNRTAAEWNQNENIELLPCEKTFYRELNATR